MSKFVEKELFSGTKTILKYNDFAAVREVFEDTHAAVTTVDGKKIIPAGTIHPANDATAIGVVLNDVDVTHGDALGAVVKRGFIDLTKLPVAPEATAITALKQITFE